MAEPTQADEHLVELCGVLLKSWMQWSDDDPNRPAGAHHLLSALLALLHFIVSEVPAAQRATYWRSLHATLDTLEGMDQLTSGDLPNIAFSPIVGHA